MRRRLTGWPARLAPHLLFLIPELLIAAGPFVISSVARAGDRARFRMPDFFYGGQALIEGVMMRGRTTVAMSVRPPSGEIHTYSEPLPNALARGRWIKIPFARGVFVPNPRGGFLQPTPPYRSSATARRPSETGPTTSKPFWDR